MTALALQTLLLLGLSYFLGCWIACLARRIVGASAEVAREPSGVPAGAIAGAAAAGAAARQSVPTGYAPRPVAPAAPPAPVRDAFRRADTLEPIPGPERRAQVPSTASRQTPPSPSSPDPVSRFERALAGSPEVKPAPAPQLVRPAIVAGAASAAAAVATGMPRSPEARLPAGRAADDLKRIRMIDGPLEIALHRLGIRTFAEIGAWKPADVARISNALGFDGRIEQENWIEQAQILSSGKDTHYSSLLANGELLVSAQGRPAVDAPAQKPAAVPTPSAPASSVVTVPRASAPQTPAASASSISRATEPPVRTERVGVDVATAAAAAMAAAAAAAARPSSSGAMTTDTKPAEAPRSQPPASVPAATPAAATDKLTEAPRPAVASRDALQRIGGITPEIERLLYAQGVSRYGQIAQWTATDVERFDRLLGHQGRIRRENWVEQAQILARGGDTASSRDADRRASEVESPKATAAVTRVQAPSQPVPAAPVTTPVAAQPAAPAPASVASPRPAEPSLRSEGPVSLVGATAAASAAVASLAPARLSPAPAAPTPAPSAAPPVLVSDAQRAGDLSSLRSVRSEALRGGGTSPFASRPGETHDLKRIRGIGVLIEKKLNQMGVSRYEQIAEWTVADIERVSHVLDFKGRIERENWVEQARILASGGQTEFSRRADRGEIGGV